MNRRRFDALYTRRLLCGAMPGVDENERGAIRFEWRMRLNLLADFLPHNAREKALRS
jgi:hypothetical protein